MLRQRALPLILIAAIVVACFALPFTWLSGVDRWYGSFLFWTLATLAVIGLTAHASARWKD